MTTYDWVVLGTVQIGLPYGVKRNDPLLPEADAQRILDAAWDLGIRAFDTAEAYGESVARLARWVNVRRRGSDAAIVTKVKPEHESLRSVGERAIETFAGVSDITLLSHGVTTPSQWEEIAAAARARNATPGLSVYTADEVQLATQLSGCQLVQAPGNVLDQRALRARGGAPIRLDIRSVFLQGLLLAAATAAEKRVNGAGSAVRAVHAAAREAGAAADALLIAAARSFLRKGDRLVLGADAPDQLGAVARAAEIAPTTTREFVERVSAIAVHPDVLDPRKWQ